MEEIRKRSLGSFLDIGDANVRTAKKQGAIDGGANHPESEAQSLSSWEEKFVASAKNAWSNYSSLMRLERDRSIAEFNAMTENLERESNRTGDTLGQRQKKALDILEAESGEGSITYRKLKTDYDEKRRAKEEIERKLGRPLQVSLLRGYLPLMVLLAIAEIPVNRLAFELFFESMPAVSLLLSGAVGCLLIFFAHIVGKQYRHTQCPITSKDKQGVLLAIGGMVFISVLLMFFLGMMREQLVALQAGASINLEDLSLDDLAAGKGADPNAFSFTIGTKGAFLILLNFVIFLAGILASYFRHDSHPFLERLTKDSDDAKQKFDRHMKSFEDRQISILKQFNSEVMKNEDEYQKREDQINQIKSKREIVDRELELSRQMMATEINRAMRAYREENLASRTSPPPEYFTQNLNSTIAKVFE